jgi:hypothetical protein
VTYTGNETNLHYSWYSVPAAHFNGSEFTGDWWNIDPYANISALMDWPGDTITLPDYTAGRYLYCQIVDSDTYEIFQRSEIVLVSGEPIEIIPFVIPPAPPMPAQKRTAFGFENVGENIRMGISGEDMGPADFRRSSGVEWNPGGGTWASTEWSTFTDIYELTAIEYSGAPEGNKVGKWVNKLGVEMPEGKGHWSSSLISLNLDDPRHTYNVGATEFTFWIDASQYYHPPWGGLIAYPQFSLEIYEGDTPTDTYGTYRPGGAAYYMDGEEWVGVEINEWGQYIFPGGYVGYLRYPLEYFTPAPWTSHAPEVMPLNNIIQVNLYLFTYEGEGAMDTFALIDDFAFMGDNMPEMPLNYYAGAINPENGLMSASGLDFEDLYVKDISDSGASVVWDSIEGYSNNYTLLLFSLEDFDDEIGTFLQRHDNLSDTGFTLTGLELNKVYAVQAVAYNATEERIATYAAARFRTAPQAVESVAEPVAETTASEPIATPEPVAETRDGGNNTLIIIVITVIAVLVCAGIFYIKKRNS